jgi:hypothetical protein
MGVAYDLLYNDLSEAERKRYRAGIARHAHLLYEYFAPRPGRTWSYSQNHTFIPIAGLAVAAYAVYGEVPEAAKWASLSRAIYDRVLATYSKDGTISRASSTGYSLLPGSFTISMRCVTLRERTSSISPA